MTISLPYYDLSENLDNSKENLNLDEIIRPSGLRHSAKDTLPKYVVVKSLSRLGCGWRCATLHKSEIYLHNNGPKNYHRNETQKKGKIYNKLGRCCCAATAVCSNNCSSEHVISILWIQQQSVLPGMFIFSPCREKVFNPFFVVPSLARLILKH